MAASRTWRAHVVEEHEEGAAGRDDATVHRHTDHRRTHRMLTDAVVHLPAAGMFERLCLLALQFGAGVAGEVGGAGEQAGHSVERCVERLLDGDTGGDLLAQFERRQRGFPAGDTGGTPTCVPRGLVDRRRCLALATIARTRRRPAPRSDCGRPTPAPAEPRTACRGFPSPLWCE